MRSRSLAATFHVKHHAGLSQPAGSGGPRLVRILRLTAVLALIVAFSGCTLSRSPVSGKKRAYAYSWDQEVQLGREADQQIQAAYGVYDDEALTRYVTEIGQDVLAHSDMREPDTPQIFRDTEFYFRVLDSPVVNAFALPGGYIYVTRGLLAHLNNEAQLAVVLGHEIGHVAARHASQRALEQQLGQIALLGGAIAGQELLDLPAQEIMNLGSTAAQILFLSYSRDDERESDNLGVEYAARAGYRAGEGAEFFNSLKRISASSGESIPNWMSSHPDPGEREQTIQRLASEWDQRVDMTRIDQERLYAHLAAIVLGENPRQGFERDGVFYHPDLAFQFPVPEGFTLTNQPTRVTMVEEQQRAAAFFTLSDAASPREGARDLLGQQGIQSVDSGPATVSDLDAYYAVADAEADGQTLRLLSYYVAYQGQVYQFTGYSLRSAFDTYARSFREMMTGFAPLRDETLLAIQPARADVVEAPRRDTFESFLATPLPFELTPTDLAIMNQLELRDEVDAGRALKLGRTAA